jgi:hypothetical protein
MIGGVEKIHLAQDRDQWLILTNTVMMFEFHKLLAIS